MVPITRCIHSILALVDWQKPCRPIYLYQYNAPSLLTFISNNVPSILFCRSIMKRDPYYDDHTHDNKYTH